MVSAWSTGHQRAEQCHRQDQRSELSAICQRFTSHPRRKAKSQKYRELVLLAYRETLPRVTPRVSVENLDMHEYLWHVASFVFTG